MTSTLLFQVDQDALAPALFATGHLKDSLSRAIRDRSQHDGSTVLGVSRRCLGQHINFIYKSDKIFANWADTPSVSVNRDGDVPCALG